MTDDVEVVEYDPLEMEFDPIPILLDELVADIDAREKLITSTHSFQTKIAALRELFVHLEMQYGDVPDLYRFFEEITEKIVRFGDLLDKIMQGELHFVKEEKAAASHSEEWRMEHRRETSKEGVRVREVTERTIRKIHEELSAVRELCVTSKHLFSVHIGETRVKKVKIDLTTTQLEVRHILNKLVEFFLTYEHLFNEVRERESLRRVK